MAKFRWQTARIALLATILVASLGALARAAFGPNPNEIKAAEENYDFPTTVPLAEWQQVETQSQAVTNEEIPNPGREYQYRQNGKQLTVEVRYERYTSNISRFINVYTPIQPGSLFLQGKRQEGIGYYALFEYEDRAYLSACLNPIGESTITQQQFVQNRYRHGWSTTGVLLWVIGQRDLLDGRCFWTLMSVPVTSDADDSAVLEDAYGTLESAWSDWYRWWRSQIAS